MTVIFPTVTAMSCALFLSTFFNLGLKLKKKENFLSQSCTSEKLRTVKYYQAIHQSVFGVGWDDGLISQPYNPSLTLLALLQEEELELQTDYKTSSGLNG